MVQGSVRLILLLSLLAGCATRGPDISGPLTMPESDPLNGSPAMSLLDQAEQSRERGELASAGRYLERALNLAPGSSWLYRELALLRMQQGDARAAEGFARRALHQAPDDNVYRAALYELLATALARQSDDAGARDARQQAAVLRAGR
jgi:predicted Zn-dependent protease